MKKMIITLLMLSGFAAQAADIICQYQVGTRKLGDSGVKYFEMTFKDGAAEILSKNVKGYNVFAMCSEKNVCEIAITNNATQVSAKVQEINLEKSKMTPLSLTESDAVALLACEKQ